MPIHLHLNLPTSPNPAPKPPPHTFHARTLYHSKRLQDPRTKDADISALAEKVAKIAPTIYKLLAQLNHSKTSAQSFADTANAAIIEILEHSAHVVFGKVDPPTPKKDITTTYQNSTNHHSSQNPQEAHLQRTIQHYRDAIYALKNTCS